MSETVVCKAVAYHESLPEGRAAGEVFTTSRGIHFESPARSWVLPVEGLEVSFEGFNRLGGKLAHAEHPGLVIVCADAAFTRLPGVADHPAFAATFSKAQKQQRKSPVLVKIFLVLVVLLLAGLVGIWLMRDRIIDAVVDKVPHSVEETIGDGMVTQMQASGKLMDDAAYRQRVDEIVKRMRPALTATPYSFNFHIVRDASLNAFACPGGEIFIHTGLLDAAKRPEEVAGVLSHEIAHVTRRHSLRNMVSSLGLGVLISSFFGDATGVAALVTEGAQSLMEQKYSRDLERDADAAGFDLLVQADIDPSGMVDFFRRLREEEQRGGGGLPASMAMLSTHPATEERITYLQGRLAEVKGRTFPPLPGSPPAP